MIYITGDMHGEQYRFLYLEKGAKIKEGDYVIVCGDFGFLFLNDRSENLFLDDLSKRGYTILFVDGNHCNFPAIYSYPCIMWNGAKVHKIRENIYHLMRGQTVTLEGKKFFCMGGAYSIDRYLRKKGYSYWEEELPNDEEYREATKNLEANGYEVDYILSHTAPQKMIRALGYYPDRHDAELTGFLDWVMENCKYEKWYFGHFHEDKWVDLKHRAVYYDIIEL